MKSALIATLCLLFLSLGFSQTQDDDPEVVITREDAPSAEAIRLTEFARDFSRPIFMTHAGDGSGRLFVVEQTGKIWIMLDGVLSNFPFLDISGVISPSANRQYSEQGLLGLAFHPQYLSNGVFFVNYTDQRGDTIVARYRVSLSNPDIADASSSKMIFKLAQPYANHNGGHIAFGPDGYLYIGLGDGGSANDPLGAGQNRMLLLGSMLRIDIDGALPFEIPADNPFVGDEKARDEIWAYGLRNVWRFSFDRQTGDMYIGDVGQNKWEEINFQPADSEGGENYGWNVWEASQPFAGGTAESHVPPIFEYPHSLGCSVTGGYVYRGKAIPQLEATYIFGDYCTGRMWVTYRDPDMQWQTEAFLNTGMAISSFAEDEDGEIYVIDYAGIIYRIDPA